MPFFSLTRFLFNGLSWLLLAGAIYLLWTGAAGREIVDPQGEILRARDPWRLWLGGALLAWSVVGRFPTLWLTARPDHTPSRAVRNGGRMIDSASGSRLYVEEGGAGPTVLLTHGWGMDSTIWGRTRGELRDRLRLLSWDLPGLGLSRLPSGGRSSLESYAEDVRGLVLAQAEPVVLAGHSIGGMIIQTLAREHPELFGRQVAGVVLLNTTYTDPSGTMVFGGIVRAFRPLVRAGLRLTAWLQPVAWLSAWQSYLSGAAHLANRFGFGAEATRSQLEHTTLLATRNPPGVQARGIRAMLDWDADGALAGVDCPILVIAGGVDLVTKREASEHIVRTSPGAILRFLPEANHMGFLEQAEVYSAEILAFVEALPSSGFIQAPHQRARAT